jgi:hypothetical protein
MRVNEYITTIYFLVSSLETTRHRGAPNLHRRRRMRTMPGPRSKRVRQRKEDLMPFVRIALESSRLQKSRHGIADRVHRAMVKAIGIPEGDRLQIIREHDADLVCDPHYLDIKRTDCALGKTIRSAKAHSPARLRGGERRRFVGLPPSLWRGRAPTCTTPSSRPRRRRRQVGYRSTRIQPSN